VKKLERWKSHTRSEAGVLRIYCWCRRSLLLKGDRTGDKERRGGNTVVESRCCSDSYCDKTGEKNIEKLFKLVSFDGELSEELNRELNNI
jgi:hypothetical protein